MKYFICICLFFLLFASGLSAQITWNDTLRAHSLYQTAMSNYDSAQYAKALPAMQEVARIWVALLPQGSPGEAAAVLRTGICLYKTGKYTHAVSPLQRALVLYPLPTADRSKTLQWSGLNLMAQGHYQASVAVLAEAADISKAVYGAEHLETARAWGILGTACNYAGQYEEAIKLQEKVLQIRRRQLPADHPSIANACMVLGESHQFIRRYAAALTYFQMAYDLQIGTLGPDHYNIAYAHSGIGQVLLALREPQKALEHFIRERDIFLVLKKDRTPDFVYPCSDLGKAYFALHQYDTALVWFQRAVGVYQVETGPNTTLRATLLHHLGNTQLALGDLEGAEASFREDQRIIRTLFGESSYEGNYQLESDQARLYAQWYQKTGKDSLMVRSRHHYSRMVALLEDRLQREPSVILQRKYLYDMVPFVERAIDMEYRTFERQKDPTALENAWAWSERMHSFQLYNAVQESRIRQQTDLPDTLLKQEYALQTAISDLQKYEKYLIEYKGKTLIDPEVLENRARYRAKVAALDSVTATLHAHNPEYTRWKNTLRLPLLTETRSLLSPRQTLLEYFVGDSTVFVFVINPLQTHFLRLPLAFPLEKTTQAFRTGIAAYHTAAQPTDALYEKSLRQYISAAHELYSYLLLPVEHLLTEEVCIVTDGPLHDIPFEALLTALPSEPANFDTYAFWIKKHVVSYPYAAALWQPQRPTTASSAPSDNSFLGFAPFFKGDPASLTISKNQGRDGFLELPASGREIVQANKHLGGRGEVFLGEAATRAVFLQKAGQYSILHLSTHAQANNQSGDWSFVAFTDRDGNMSNLLYAADIYPLSLRAKLVVLSACETSAGAWQRGEGVFSLSRAFTYAGAANVVASLWKVSDQSILYIMDAFYSQIQQKGCCHSRVLAAAKHQYLKNYRGAAAHPFFWLVWIKF